MKWIVLDAMGVVFTEDTIDLIIKFVKSKKDIDSKKIRDLYLRGSLGEFKSKEIWKKLDLDNSYPAIEIEYLENNFKLRDDFLSVIRDLKKEYKIAMLSNDVSEWSKYLRIYFEIEDIFDELIISGEVSYRKPDKKIYEIFLNKVNAKAKDCVFIDDIEENLKSAKELGINVIKFASSNSTGIYETIDSFEDLRLLLKPELSI